MFGDERMQEIATVEVPEIDSVSAEETGKKQRLWIARDQFGVRVIFDQFKDDSDILIEATEAGLSILFHPAAGDAVMRVILNEHGATVEPCPFALRDKTLEIKEPATL